MANSDGTSHRIVIGDSRHMDAIADESVHMVVTSPPYWQLKDYGTDSQVGFNDTYEDYINNLSVVWSECARVLHKGCRLCVNIGDQFARAAYYGRYKVIPIRTEIIKFCESASMDYMGAIIWQKVTTCNTSGGATIMGSFPYPRNGIIKLDYEFILIFKKHGDPPPVSKAIKEQAALTTEQWNTYFSGHWHFPGEKQTKHLAAYPIELPTRLIQMFTFVGETILDPFLGSGTTALAAQNLNRNSIGYEINEEFLPIIKDKLSIGQDLYSHAAYTIENASPAAISPDEKIAALPYIFKDPLRINLQVNPKRVRFGSAIDGEARQCETYHRVKEVQSPQRLLLSSGALITLIGVVTIEAMREKAQEFLDDLTKGQRVFIKYDKLIPDETMCYLFLSNKTFVNARLIKSGLVGPDTNTAYKHKERFLRYLSERAT
ncbi:DNA methyltransferase [Candidatus Magnetominusculus dajiuhuensis]|uniref:DNA methyltransferase n=1 Tax=Candidatus Magnetominusculus dajiuhuensis TaxID=3137712 RepID=UPI003B4394B3